MEQRPKNWTPMIGWISKWGDIRARLKLTNLLGFTYGVNIREDLRLSIGINIWKKMLNSLLANAKVWSWLFFSSHKMLKFLKWPPQSFQLVIHIIFFQARISFSLVLNRIPLTIFSNLTFKFISFAWENCKSKINQPCLLYSIYLDPL